MRGARVSDGLGDCPDEDTAAGTITDGADRVGTGTVGCAVSSNWEVEAVVEVVVVGEAEVVGINSITALASSCASSAWAREVVNRLSADTVTGGGAVALAPAEDWGEGVVVGKGSERGPKKLLT